MTFSGNISQEEEKSRKVYRQNEVDQFNGLH